MRKLNKIQNLIFMAGAVLILLGVAVYPMNWLYGFYIYAVGACAFVAMQLRAGYDGDNLVVRRLRFQQVAGGLLLLCTAFFMAMRTFNFGFAREGEWMICLAIACVLELYTAFRIPSELNKDLRRKNDNKI